MHDKSWMTALATNNYEVRSLLYKHNERVRKGHNNAYNPEFAGGISNNFPHLPNCKFVGTGLSKFRDEEKAAAYTGAVNVLPFESSARRRLSDNDDEESTTKWVTVADRSGSFQVLITKKVRQELQSLQPGVPLVKVLNSKSRFLVTIRTIVTNHDDKKHFVLTNLAQID